jgi:hypothetical protein
MRRSWNGGKPNFRERGRGAVGNFGVGGWFECYGLDHLAGRFRAFLDDGFDDDGFDRY